MRHLAFLVHIFTALGAGLALLAMHAAVENDWPRMFAILGLALVVDGLDGPLARLLQTGDRLPKWSGDTLDLVVDFATYVFVPSFAIISAGLMPLTWGMAAGCLIMVTGALYFCRQDMKASDNSFRGFPAVWNLVAFYLLLLRPSPVWCGVIIVVLAGMQFSSVHFVHPMRVQGWRWLTLALVLAWLALAIWAVLQALEPEPWVTAALCAIGIYFVAIGAVIAQLGRSKSSTT